MPFDGNKWNSPKMFPYTEMLKLIKTEWSDFEKLVDSPSDTSKVTAVFGSQIHNKSYENVLVF